MHPSHIPPSSRLVPSLPGDRWPGDGFGLSYQIPTGWRGREAGKEEWGGREGYEGKREGGRVMEGQRKGDGRRFEQLTPAAEREQRKTSLCRRGSLRNY